MFLLAWKLELFGMNLASKSILNDRACDPFIKLRFQTHGSG